MANSILNGASQGQPKMDLISSINRFKAAFRGNPKQQVDQLLQSGQVSQQQLEQAMQMAKQVQGLFGN